MNKNLKRIVAMALAFGVVSAIAPATNVNLLTTQAYAKSDANDKDTLKSLDLETSSGSSIKLYSDDDYKSDNKVDNKDISDGSTYYAKTSSDKIKISAKGPNSKYVRVFTGTSNSTKGKKISGNIDLSSGTNILTVKVYSEEPKLSVKYKDDDNVKSEYTIKVKCTGSDKSDKNSYDDIYLDTLSVDGSEISILKSKTSYDYSVKESVDEVTIKAKPEDEDYKVTIDGSTVDDSDKYKKTVSLNKGKNEIKVKVKNEDDDEERVYTLKVTRESSTATTTPNIETNVVTATVKANQWVQTNGVWKYNDSNGNPIKNSWVQNYYVKEDGSMATGWLINNGSWYYLGGDGAKKTGWQNVGGTWYYLDNAEGRMQTGWMKDITGKYYYLNSNGSMASNTTIGGYKLGTDGAWITR